jgi:hypothetical protein
MRGRVQSAALKRFSPVRSNCHLRSDIDFKDQIMSSSTNTPASTAHNIRDRRSFFESLLETLFTALPFGLLIYALSVVWGGDEWKDQLPFLVAMGKGALIDSGMVLPTLFALVLGFYVAFIGQTIVGPDAVEVKKMRDSLGVTAQFIAAIATVYSSLVVVAAIDDPELLPRLTGIVIMLGVVVALGASTGTFAFGSLLEQKALADRRAAFAEERADDFSQSIYNGWLAALALVATGASLLVPALVLVTLENLDFIADGWWRPAIVAAVFGMFALIIVGASTFAFLTSETKKLTGWAYGVLIAAFALAAGLLGFAYSDEIPGSNVRSGVLTMVFVIIVLALLWVPLTIDKLDKKWLPGSAIRSLAFVWLRAREARAKEQSLRLAQLMNVTSNATTGG